MVNTVPALDLVLARRQRSAGPMPTEARYTGFLAPAPILPTVRTGAALTESNSATALGVIVNVRVDEPRWTTNTSGFSGDADTCSTTSPHDRTGCPPTLVIESPRWSPPVIARSFGKTVSMTGGRYGINACAIAITVESDLSGIVT